MAEIWTYDAAQGRHVPMPIESGQPAQAAPEPVSPAAVAEPPQPDVAGQSTEAGTGETPPPDTSAVSPEPDALPDEPVVERHDRPFVTRTIRENERLKMQLQQAQAQLQFLMEQGQRQMGQQMQQTPQPGTAPQVPASDGPPRYESYNGDNERYWRDLARYEARQEALQVYQAQMQELQAQQAQRFQETHRANMRQLIATGQRTHEDFDEAFYTLANSAREDLFPVIERVALERQDGAALLRTLGRSPRLVQELNRFVPDAAYQWLKEQALQPGQRPPPTSQPPQQQSGLQPANALRQVIPPPVTPLTGGSAGVGVGAGTSEIAARGGSLLDYMRTLRQEQAPGRR